MSPERIVEILYAAFCQLNEQEFGRLERYVKQKRHILCGEKADYYSKDDRG